jgi:nitrous oxide reductase accessory protein NosL
MTLIACLFFGPVALGMPETVEPPQACAQCGMDRTMHAESRMLITYADGTGAGVCSIRCAMADIRKHGDGRVESLRVADYAGKQLIDARTAVWVIGGNIPGGMNVPPKWAFAKTEDAEAFMKVNGGRPATYAQAAGTAIPETSAKTEIPMAPAITNAPSPAAPEEYLSLPKPGKKVPFAGGQYFIYGFDRPPKLGVCIVRVQIFTADGKPDTSLVVKGDADMPSMRGAHGSGARNFALSAKGVYLMPVRLVMPGRWEIRFIFEKEGKVIFGGAHLFDI